MKHIIPKTIAIFMIVATVALAADPNDITYMTEQYPPFNFEQDGMVQGIGVDVMLLVMKKLKIDRPIRVLPWANAYQRVQAVPDTCLFLMIYTPERAPLFKWVGPVFDDNVELVALKKNNIKINNMGDANNYRIGAIRSDIGEQLLLKNGVKPENIDLVAETIFNIRKLANGRIDLIAYGGTSPHSCIKKMAKRIKILASIELTVC